jgi:hypothetical protein
MKLKACRVSLLLAAVLWFAAEPAWALRCGRLLVLQGDRKAQVWKKCGEPDFTDRRVEYRLARLRGSGLNRPGLDYEEMIPIVIDEWTYNFGPRQFMQLLVFENGRLVRIQNLEYGD